MERLNSRTVYWKAEQLRLAEERKSRSPLREGREAFEELIRIIQGPHEKIAESTVRAVVAQQHGIKPEEVTWPQIRFEAYRTGYRAIEIVPSDPAASKKWQAAPF